jgi:cellulose synthase/poly-beta-1,6-N-acetylglucosamine synthase-like glycosyltransferase
MSTIFYNLYEIFQALVLLALGIPVLYLFFFAMMGKFYRLPKFKTAPAFRKIAVLIPAYKEDRVIVDVARDALLQEYPGHLFDVIVIADSLEPATVARLKEIPVRVIEVSFEQSTKAKALNRALEVMDESYGIAVILDADNIMERDFLYKINASFDQGLLAVQGHRTASNLDTSLAVLDGISEEINNHIFRKGHRAVGLSSAIIGSGIAFQYGFFRELMPAIKAIGGFDKEIELKMLKEGHTVGYLGNALVYDEKVRKADAFINQRRRWLSAQFYYLRQDFLQAFKALILHRNVDYFDKALQFLLPPRILLLGAVFLSGIVFSLINLIVHTRPGFEILWLILGSFCILIFALSIPRSFYTRRNLHALLYVPMGMILMFRSLLKIKGANRQFLHTEHHQATPAKTPVSGPNDI